MVIAVFTLLFCTYLFFGSYVLALNTKERLNKLFFLITLVYAVSCLGGIFVQTGIKETARQHWYISSTIFYNLNLYLILVFNIQLTKVLKPIWYVFLLFSIPIIYLTILTLNIKDMAVFYELNYIEYRFGGESEKVMNQITVINLFYLLVSSTLLLKRYYNSSQIKTKKQVLIILITLFISITLAFIDHVVLFEWINISSKRIPGIILFYSLIWIFGIGYALVKYRFLTLDIATINRHIIYHIDEMVILVSPDFHVLLVNQKLKEITQLKNNLYGKHISSLVHESELIMNELAEHPGGDETTISCHLHFKDKENKKICANAKIKKIRDKFQDNIGYLIIAKELRGVRQLQEIYKITDREANIIQAVIAGRTNHEIADELGITERTVKSHMTHTFNKLNVTSRVQLLIKLKDFHLIPEGEADRILFSKEEPPEDFQPSAQP